MTIVQLVPGWKALEQYANDSWGKGKREVVTNPEDVCSILPILRSAL